MAEPRRLSAILRKSKRVRATHDVSDRLIQTVSVLGFADYRVWYNLLAEFADVYESIARKCSSPQFSAAMGEKVKEIFEPLERNEAFQADLAFFAERGGVNEKSKGKTLATKQYIATIERECEEFPYLALVYAHTMYSALLAGGTVLRKIQRGAMLLPVEEERKTSSSSPSSSSTTSSYELGSAIFDYSAAIGGRSEQARWRRRMNSLIDEMGADLSEEEVSRCLESKTLIFSWNNRIVIEVLRKAPASAYFSLPRAGLRALGRGDITSGLLAIGVFSAFTAVALLPVLLVGKAVSYVV